MDQQTITFRLMPPSSTGKLRIEASTSHKDELLGNTVTRRGYLDFGTVEEQKAAYEKLSKNEVSVQFGQKNRQTGLWDITPVAVVETEVEAAQ